MKKIIIAGIVFAILISGVSLAGFFYVQNLKKQPSTDGPESELELTQENIVALTKPSIVRIIQHVKGKAELPDYSIDFENFEIIPKPENPKTEIPLDEYLSGSGAIVNENGYIITNSHVISYETIKLELILAHTLSKLYIELMDYAFSGGSDLTEDPNSEELLEKLGEKILEYSLAEGKYEIDKKLSVLNPHSSKEKIEDLFEDGYPARVVSVNDNFYKDNKDVALIKIDENNLPSIKIGDSTNISTGNKIYVFGFPSSAEFNNKNLLESTFTPGSISALKDSDNKDFKIFQTDAKVSQGSSGGPMLNDKGEILGIVTYQSDPIQQESGDNFAFAVPSQHISNWIQRFTVNSPLAPTELNKGDYANHYLNGLELMENNRCKKSIEKFKLAENVNSDFSTYSYTNPHVEECEKVIASGDSIDTLWDEKKIELEKINFLLWGLIIGGAVLIVGIIFVVIILMKKLKKDEEEIDHLEESLSHLDHIDDTSVPDNTVIQRGEMKMESSPINPVPVPKNEKTTTKSSRPVPPINPPPESPAEAGEEVKIIKLED